MKESTPLITNTLRTARERAIGRAAHLIKNAVIGRQDAPYEGHFDPYENRELKVRNAISIMARRIRVRARGVVLFASWVMFLLTLFEPPAWCRYASNLHLLKEEGETIVSDDGINSTEYGECKYLLSEYGKTEDGEENQQLYPNTNTMLLTIHQSEVIETICMCLVAIYVVISFAVDGFVPSLFFYPGHKRRMHSIQCLAPLCLFTYAIVDDYASAVISPFLRLLILWSFLEKNHRELSTFMNIIKRMMLPLSLLSIIILFYAWFGVVIFHGSPEGEEMFPNLADGIWTLWTCVTTANYPDVMMPSYNIYRGTALYFMSFMVLCYFYVMNLVLAVAVNTYDDNIRVRKTRRADLSKTLLNEAFTLLDSNDENFVSRETILHVLETLDEDVPDFQGLSDPAVRNIMFAFLDRSGNNAVNRDEFLEFDSILQLHLGRHSIDTTFIEVHFPSIYESYWYQKFASFIKSSKFDNAVEVVLMMNLILVFAQDYPLLVGKDATLSYKITVWENLETVFTAAYVVEALVKILVNGWKLYIESIRNCFDLFITILVVVATAWVYYPNGYSNPHLIQLIATARVFRVGRLLFAIERFRVFGAIPAEIIPAASSVFVLLCFTAYFFASLGMILFGGLITRDPLNDASQLLEGTSFTASKYWANNFNDMLSSLCVLFNLMIVNNWITEASGLEASENRWLVRLFIFSFHLVGVIGISNVTTSLIINGFFQQFDKMKSGTASDEKIESEREEVVLTGSWSKSRAIFDPSCITGTETGLPKILYSVRVKSRHSSTPSDMNDRDVLRKLFSKASSDDNELLSVESIIEEE